MEFNPLFFPHCQGIRPKSTSARNVAQPMVSAVQSASATPLWKLLGSNYIFIRIAAVSGASAVCLAAYGRHQFKDTHDTKEIKAVYESANSMHIIHSVVLLAVPLARRPIVVSFVWKSKTIYKKKNNFFLIQIFTIFADWISIHRWNGAVQRHLLL